MQQCDKITLIFIKKIILNPREINSPHNGQLHSDGAPTREATSPTVVWGTTGNNLDLVLSIYLHILFGSVMQARMVKEETATAGRWDDGLNMTDTSCSLSKDEDSVSSHLTPQENHLMCHFSRMKHPSPRVLFSTSKRWASAIPTKRKFIIKIDDKNKPGTLLLHFNIVTLKAKSSALNLLIIQFWVCKWSQSWKRLGLTQFRTNLFALRGFWSMLVDRDHCWFTLVVCLE